VILTMMWFRAPPSGRPAGAKPNRLLNSFKLARAGSAAYRAFRDMEAS
jgi:hypothetical protein